MKNISIKIVVLLAGLVMGVNAAGASDLPDCSSGANVKHDCLGTVTSADGDEYVGELDYKIADGQFSTSEGLIPSGCFGQLMTELNGDNSVAAIFVNRASLRGCIASNYPYPGGDEDEITYEIIEQKDNHIFKLRVCQVVGGSMGLSCGYISIQFKNRDYKMPDKLIRVLSLEKIGEW